MRLRLLALWICLLTAPALLGTPATEIVGTGYSADTPFHQYLHLWMEGWALRDQRGEPLQYATTNMPLGAYLHVYIRNTSNRAVTIDDVKLDGVSLTKGIAFADKTVDNLYPASVHFSKLPQSELDRLQAAGEPVWWKVEPPALPPGGEAEVTIRLRRQSGKPASVHALASNHTWTAEVAPTNTPRFMGLSFSPSLDTVYGYVQHPQPAHPAPTRVLLDGEDVTARSTISDDSNVEVAPVVIRLARPLAKGSFHSFQACYDDGSTALAGIRAWGDDLVYGMWGYSKKGKTAQERVDYYIKDMQRHNVNAVMQSYGAEVGEFFTGQPGIANARATGIRAMRSRPDEVLNPVYYFLTDEPDAHDYAVSQLKPTQRLGVLGQDLVRRSQRFRQQDAGSPQLLNLDNTFKPENWYMYAQLADVCCADPYYQEQQRIMWNDRPAWVPSFIRPLYVLGAATICQSACAPKPLHIILNSVRHDLKGGQFRFATPAEKSVELFYALGAGAKHFSYWWYTPYGEFYGCGAEDKEAVALWRQIGLLGAQVRTAGPVLTRSCPAPVPLKAPSKLWTRTLLAGTDTLVLLAVNENIANDRLGTVVKPIQETPVTLTSPGWLNVADAFEVTPEGVRDVSWKSQHPGIALDLGTTEVARLVVLTADKALRPQLSQLYQDRFSATVAQLGSDSSRTRGSPSP